MTGEAQGKSFDGIADLYESARPSYPEALVLSVERFAQLERSSRILEVGSGTGKATVAFAQRGYAVLCLEPGPNLVCVAQSRLANSPRVQIETTSFEDWEASPDAFDLAFAAQSFHWLDPALRLGKFAHILRRGGTLAIFGNVPSIVPGELRDKVARAYATHAPTLARSSPSAPWYGTATSPIAAELERSPDFRDVQYERFVWEREVGPQEYCGLVNSYSDHIALGADRLSRLTAALCEVIQTSGGLVALQYRTGLFLARTV